jgi:general secretion pathway protein F
MTTGFPIVALLGAADGPAIDWLFGQASGFLPFVILVWLLAWFLPLGIFFYAIYFLLSLPLRRQERARLLVDLLEAGLQQGRSVEHAIVEISQTHEPSVGARFHLLAAYLEKGLRLSQALENVPRLLPPQLTAMLKTGEQIGDVARVLPACRHLLKDAQGRLLKAQNYFLFLFLFGLPLPVCMIKFIGIWVLPRFIEIARDMGQPPTYGLLPWLVDNWMADVLLLLATVLLGLGTLIYVGGPRLIAWMQAALPRWLDALFYAIPWHRRRMQRDFSAMLTVLLDANVPEATALRLAAASTANAVFCQRTEQAVADLQAGATLGAALKRLDDSGEFHWRLANALHASGRFAEALRGWQDALDARAFQLEQAAAQTASTLLVLVNGVVVGLLAVGVFGLLINLIGQATLW